VICTTCFTTNMACQTCNGSGVMPDPQAGQKKPRFDLRKFGTEECPIHASAVPELIKCSWKTAMMLIFTPTDESNEAADTGSACHVAVADWHRNKDVNAAIAAMQAKRDAKFPKADLAEAAAMFLRYIKDPRNIQAEFAKINGELFIEKSIKITLRPSEEDKTQAPIKFVGTIDQVRLVNGRPRVWDLKTSKRPGWELLNMHIYQIAIYCVGASKALRMPVTLGGLITPRHYGKEHPEKAPTGVFWEYPHKFGDLEPLLNGVRHAVAAIRAGDVHPSPGEQCRYCPAHETSECVPLLRSVSDPVSGRIFLPTVP
jgi:hypothetical protein